MFNVQFGRRARFLLQNLDSGLKAPLNNALTSESKPTVQILNTLKYLEIPWIVFNLCPRSKPAQTILLSLCPWQGTHYRCTAQQFMRQKWVISGLWHWACMTRKGCGWMMKMLKCWLAEHHWCFEMVCSCVVAYRVYWFRQFRQDVHARAE